MTGRAKRHRKRKGRGTSMIGISKLYCGAIEASDELRYKRRSRMLPNGLLEFVRDKKPVVVWNCTKTCNLRCQHCYAESDARTHDQLSTPEAKAMIDDLASFGSPALLISGGEPCMRPDLLELAAYARQAGLRVTPLYTKDYLFAVELGAGLRLSGIVPDWFIAFFYTGLGTALALTGILFLKESRPNARDDSPR